MNGFAKIILAIVAGAALATVGKPRAARASAPRFPTVTAGKNDLRSIAQDVEQEIGMPGFADFAVGVAENESRFKNLAIDDKEPARAAGARGYDNNPKKFHSSGYPRSDYTWGTGGWYQMLPSTALASSEWNDADPMLVFAPVASTVLLASFIQRVMRNHFGNLPASERHWATMRRFLRSNTAGYDYNEELEGTRGKRERFGRDLVKNGIPESFMWESIPTGSVRATPDVYARVLARRGMTAENLYPRKRQ